MSDEESFSEFVRARGAALSRLAYLLARDRHHAEDLLQSALYKAALRWGRIDADGREAYVRKILYNGAVSSWRRYRIRPESLTARGNCGVALGERKGSNIPVPTALPQDLAAPAATAPGQDQCRCGRPARSSDTARAWSAGPVLDQCHRRGIPLI